MLDEDISYDMANRSALLRGYFLLEDESLRQQFENEVEASIALENELMELSDSESTKELLNKKYEWGTLTDRRYKRMIVVIKKRHYKLCKWK